MEIWVCQHMTLRSEPAPSIAGAACLKNSSRPIGWFNISVYNNLPVTLMKADRDANKKDLP